MNTKLICELEKLLPIKISNNLKLYKLKLEIDKKVFIDKIIDKYNPAITIVEECNKAEIGVGAAIALINHE